MAWKAVKKAHAAEFGNKHMKDEEERVVCGYSERIGTVTL